MQTADNLSPFYQLPPTYLEQRCPNFNFKMIFQYSSITVWITYANKWPEYKIFSVKYYAVVKAKFFLAISTVKTF